MYSLIVKHNGQIIIHRTLTSDELATVYVSGNTIQLVINAFIKYIGLDISSYGLNEFENPLPLPLLYPRDLCVTNKNRSFTIYIRNEDLEKLRDNKLNELGL
jgi:hypothetical protein